MLALLSGCGGNQSTDRPAVNSGTIDEEYVGDANVKLEEIYKQTPEEAAAQEAILKAIEEEENTFEGGGLSGH